MDTLEREDFSYYETRPAKISRVGCILQSAFEYFSSLILADLFLSKLLTALDFSQGTQGIIASIPTFAGMAQLFAVLLVRKRSGMKRQLVFWNLVCQLALALLYLTPFVAIPKDVKSLVFIFLFLIAQGIKNFIYPFASVWHMSNVGPNGRGSFRAVLQIVSLAGGFLFSLVMGRVLDGYTERGDPNGFFFVAAMTIGALALLNTLSLLPVRDHTTALITEKSDTGKGFFRNCARSFRAAFGNSAFRRILPLMLLSAFAGTSMAFFGAYKNNVLGFDGTFNAFVTIPQSILYAIATIPFGKIADKRSWGVAIRIAYLIIAVAYVVCAFAVPENGKVMVLIYAALAGIASGGTGSLSMLYYERCPASGITDVIAWNGAMGGVVSFLTSLLFSRIVDSLGAAGNTLFGVRVYGVQLLLGMSAVIYFFSVFYITFVIGVDRPARAEALLADAPGPSSEN